MKPRRVLTHPSDPGLAIVPLTKGRCAVISVVDAAEAGRHNWSLMRRYAHRAVVRNGVGTTQLLHRFIADRMGLPSGGEVDHINGNGLDCRRDNLRHATRSENARNRKLASNNVSGFTGVSRTHSGRWQGRIKTDGAITHVGTFDSAEEAHVAVLAAKAVLHGEFASPH